MSQMEASLLIGAYIGIAIVVMIICAFFMTLGGKEKTALGFMLKAVAIGAFWFPALIGLIIVGIAKQAKRNQLKKKSNASIHS